MSTTELPERRDADEARRRGQEEADRSLDAANTTTTPAPPGSLAEEIEGLPPIARPSPPLLPPTEIARRRAEQFEILAALERGDLIEVPIVSVGALKPKPR